MQTGLIPNIQRSTSKLEKIQEDDDEHHDMRDALTPARSAQKLEGALTQSRISLNNSSKFEQSVDQTKEGSRSDFDSDTDSDSKTGSLNDQFSASKLRLGKASTMKNDDGNEYRYKADLMVMENHMRQVVLNLLDKPVGLMKEQHESIEALKDVGRKNARRLYEVEFAVNKMSRACSQMDGFETAVESCREQIASEHKQTAQAMKRLEDKMTNDFPAMIKSFGAKISANEEQGRKLEQRLKSILEFNDVEKKAQRDLNRANLEDLKNKIHKIEFKQTAGDE